MAEVVNAYYHKVHISSNKVVPFAYKENLSYGRGILKFLSDSKPEEVNTLDILNCKFYFSNATDSIRTQHSFTQGQDDPIIDLFKKTFLGKGGGLSFYLQNQHIPTNTFIKLCRFYLNRAFWGSGIYLEFGEYAHRNHIATKNAQLIDNFANFSGRASQTINQNPIYFSSSTKHCLRYSFFTGNKAEVGGGLTITFKISGIKILHKP